MMIKKVLLAAAAVMALAAPVAASAQDFGGYGHRADFGRYEQRHNFYWRQIEREREIRRDEWRARFDYRPGWDVQRPY